MEAQPTGDAQRPATRWEPWVQTAVVASVALVLRMWSLSAQLDGNPLFGAPPADDAFYLELAAGDGVTRDWFLAPLYPAVLGLFSSGQRLGMGGGGAVSVAAGSLAAGAAAMVATSLHSRLAGWVAGLLFALAGVFVWSDLRPGQEPLLAVLAIASMGLVARSARRGSKGDALVAGGLIGLAMLGRGTMLALGVAAVWVLVRRLRPGRQWVRPVGALAAGLLLVLLPAAFRNLAVVGDFTPLPWSLGPNLYMANGPDAFVHGAFDANVFQQHPAVMREQAIAIAEAESGRKLGFAEVSRYWTGRTLDELPTADRVAGHLTRKALLFWGVDEYPGNHDPELERRFSPWLRWTGVTGWWILALGVGGWWLGRKRAPALDFVAVSVVLTWASLTLLFPLARYRVPALALATVAVGVGVAEAVSRSASRRRVWLALGAVGLCALAAHSPPWIYGVRGKRALQYTQLAAGYLAVDDVAGAKSILEEALEAQPNDGAAMIGLGRIAAAAGDPRGALAWFERAQQDPRARTDAAASAIGALVTIGETRHALALGEEVLANAPPGRIRAEALANVALAAWAVGDRTRARTLLGEAQSISPDHSAVVRATGSIGP